jgi:hypothetical protein
MGCMRGRSKQVSTVVVAGAVALIASGCIKWAEPVGQAVTVPAGRNDGDLVAADVDGDGDDDVLLVDYLLSTATTTVLLSDGDGTFTEGAVMNGWASPRTVADVDGDGDDDVILSVNASGTGDRQFLHRGGPNGLSTESTELARAEQYEFGDLDGDGDQDLLRTMTYMSYYFEFAGWVNDGTGTFTEDPAVTGIALPFSLYEPALHERADRSVVLPTDGIGWINGPGLPWPSPGSYWAFGDIDGDGDDDAAFEKNDQVTFYEWTGTAFVAYPPYEDIDAVGPARIQLRALDLDVGADLAITDINGTRIFGGSADGGFPYDDIGAHVVRRPTFADVDGDGLLDAVTANAAGNGIEVFLNISDA